MAAPRPDMVTILLATYQGAAYLDAQLASFHAQTHRCWRLWVSDDGSTDGTLAILHRFAKTLRPGQEFRLFHGPGAGAAANFLSLLHHPDLPAGPVALSDQDDVWLPHRLARGLAMMNETPAGRPGLYAANTSPADADLTPYRRRDRVALQPSFANALVQNILAGNTMMLNAAAIRILRAIGPPGSAVPFHDWWLYLLFSGIGAQIIHDETPCLYYRQHDRNILGAHRGGRAVAWRIHRMIDGTYGRWIARNTAALAPLAPHLSADAQARLASFAAGSGRGGLAQYLSLHRAGARRSSGAATALLCCLALTGKLQNPH
ncbi:glycosyltransferase [Rhodophyticola sp. CCM32]|uniref:glycosyltransferase n=1 Tax=Rhodophyticola sp. CCM32 TaxID=2916397 RepID=UPI00107F0BAA|nr:glycosyltransferase [Rhodophyticola sp. CCM32]QBY02242.1 glycosyltransferase [Rhodophyticola sp. CCM32]